MFTSFTNQFGACTPFNGFGAPAQSFTGFNPTGWAPQYWNTPANFGAFNPFAPVNAWNNTPAFQGFVPGYQAFAPATVGACSPEFAANTGWATPAYGFAPSFANAWASPFAGYQGYTGFNATPWTTFQNFTAPATPYAWNGAYSPVANPWNYATGNMWNSATNGQPTPGGFPGKPGVCREAA